MNNKRLHFIFPKDETTDFLNEIINYVQRETDVEIVVHRITTIDDHLIFLQKAEEILPANELIIFMGHGMSSALSGALIEGRSYGHFISEHQLTLFKNKKILLLSCRSNEYLHKFGFDAGIKAGIGFPNLITDSYELIYPDEPERVSGVTDVEIELFKTTIVDIVKYSLEDFIMRQLPFYQLFTRLKLRAQKKLLTFYSENAGKGKLPYGKMLYDLNEGIYIIGN